MISFGEDDALVVGALYGRITLFWDAFIGNIEDWILVWDDSLVG